MKCVLFGETKDTAESHPARGAWIEIASARLNTGSMIVAPRKGCVD